MVFSSIRPALSESTMRAPSGKATFRSRAWKPARSPASRCGEVASTWSIARERSNSRFTADATVSARAAKLRSVAARPVSQARTAASTETNKVGSTTQSTRANRRERTVGSAQAKRPPRHRAARTAPTAGAWPAADTFNACMYACGIYP